MKYLIDFENVASNGFEGLELLDDGSELLIFYSEQHSTISITVHQELERSRIRKTYMPIKTGGKNALDFQLVSWLGMRSQERRGAVRYHQQGYRIRCGWWISGRSGM